jgi:hypothetical protein
MEDLEVTVRMRSVLPPSLQKAEEELRTLARDPNSVTWTIEYEGRPVGFRAELRREDSERAAGTSPPGAGGES